MEGFQQTFDLNFMSAVATTKEALPHLEATKGNIVYIASLTGDLKEIILYGSM